LLVTAVTEMRNAMSCVKEMRVRPARTPKPLRAALANSAFL